MHAVVEVTDSNFNVYWSELFANDPLQNPLYSSQAGELLKPCNSISQFIDRSFVIIAEDKPVFACSLTMHTDEQGKKRLGYFGFEASTHVNRQSMQASSNNFQAEAIHLLQRHFHSLIEEIQPDSLEYIDPVSCGIMSPVTQVLIEKGALPVPQTAKIVDLTQSAHALRRKVRKSQRCMINWGQRNLDIRVCSSAQIDADSDAGLVRIFNEAMQAGTSPFSSLESYKELIRRNKAFLIHGSYNNELVASAFFLHANRTCHFVFGSAAPAAQDRPVLHALIWEALQHSKNLGCARFEMGRLAETDNAKSDRVKLLNGFGGDSQTRLKVCLLT